MVRGTGGTFHSPVVAIFNGAEGDVAASWRRRDRTETIALGHTVLTKYHPEKWMPEDTLYVFGRLNLNVSCSFIEELGFLKFMDALRHRPQLGCGTDRADLPGIL